MSSSAILIFGVACVLVLPLAWRMAKRQFDLFEPIVLFALAYGVMFVARPTSMLLHGELTAFGVGIRTTFPLAILLALAGAAAFVCGYQLSAGHTLARRLPTPGAVTTRQGVIASMILIVMALLALLVMVSPAGEFRGLTMLFSGQSPEVKRLIEGGGGYVYYTTMLVVPAALILVAIATRDRRPRIVIGALLTFAFALVLTIPLGSRSFLLPLLGGAVIFAYLSRDARPRPLTVVAIAMFALTASYTLTVVRAPDQRERLGPTLRHLAERPDTAVSFVLHGEDALMAPAFAAALHVVPNRLHYRYGGVEFGDLATRPIPRQFWTGKPQPVGEQLVGAIWPRLLKYGFNPTFSLLLFFYWDFGITGVFVGMALFGIGCRTLFEWFHSHRDCLVAQLIFATAVWYVVLGVRTNPVDTIVHASFIVLPLVLIERFSALRSPIGRPLSAPARNSPRIERTPRV